MDLGLFELKLNLSGHQLQLTSHRTRSTAKRAIILCIVCVSTLWLLLDVCSKNNRF